MVGKIVTSVCCRLSFMKRVLIFLAFRFFFSFKCFAVFHVTDLNGNKLTDESVLGCIEQVIMTAVNAILKRLILNNV